MSEPWAADAAYVYADRASVLGVWSAHKDDPLAVVQFQLGVCAQALAPCNHISKSVAQKEHVVIAGH
eukprot:1313245-Amphidinium_carterae.1